MANFLPLSAAKFPYAPPLGSSSNLLGSHSLITKTKKKSKGGGAYVNRISCMYPEKLGSVNNMAVVEDHDIAVERPLANFPPDIWGDRFDNFTFEDQLKMESYAKEIEPLREEVRQMLLDNSCDLRKKMSLINTVERLGFPYYYQNEIDDLLDHIFKQLSAVSFNLNGDLWDDAVLFRILRQHGHMIPCDIFNKYMDDEGKFKEALKSDERGMISMYEATQLRVHGEDILEEALIFTTEFLNSISCFSEQARHALLQPLGRGIPRLQAHHFISFYEQDESHDEKLLRLAKIEFNRLQLLHCQELSQIQKWYKKVDFARKFPHMRHRSIETYFVAIALYYQPQYSLARIMFFKLWTILSAVDDTYDSYATYEEIQDLTDAFERWDLKSMDELPTDYLRSVYQLVINTFSEIANEMTKKGKSFASHYAKQQAQALFRHYLMEAKWAKSSYVPKFEEYMATRRITSGVRIIVSAAMMGMDEVRDAEPYTQLLQNNPNSLITAENMMGLMNDLASGKRELAEGAIVATSIECYMKDYGIRSEEEVVQIFTNMIDDGWKDLVNEGILINNRCCNDDSSSDHDVLKPVVLDLVVNYLRGAHVFYKVTDAYTFSDGIKEAIITTFAQPFPLIN